MTSQKIFFKIEKLDSNEKVIEEKSLKLTGGRIDVGSTSPRRRMQIDLAEPLPADWQSHRWRLHYGYQKRGVGPIVYVPQGVFIPFNPASRELTQQETTNLQGSDKSKLFADYQIDEPKLWTSGTTVRAIIVEVAGWVNETKLKLDDNLGTLAADLKFEEGTTAESLISTLVSSFTAEWFYDRDGFLVARKRTDPATRPVTYEMDDEESPIYITSEKNIDETNYYNRVTVVGGTVDTEIFRATRESAEAIAKAGGRIVQKYFTVDAAVTQTQVDGRADYYLSQGVQLPAEIRLTNLVLPLLEIGDIIEKANTKYEVKSFSVPLTLGAQDISAGEIL